MKFNFDFSYRCEVKTKSAHSERRLSVRDNRTVEIEEVSSEDAPVAVTWDDYGSTGETRWYEGNHYIAVDTDLTADDLFKEMKKTQAYDQEDFNTGYFDSISSSGSYVKLDERKVEWFDEEQRDKAIELVDDWASKCLIVDGKAYFRCFEPHYLIVRGSLEVSVDEINDTLGYQGGSRAGHPYMVKKWPNLQRGFHSRFSSNQIEQALAKSDGELPYDEKVKINVLDPEAVGFDFDKAAILEAGEDFIDCFKGEKLLDLSPDAIFAIAHVSKEIWGKSINDLNGDSLAEVILSSLDKASHEISKLDHHQLSYMENVRAAVNRWDDRDIGVANSFSIGM